MFPGTLAMLQFKEVSDPSNPKAPKKFDGFTLLHTITMIDIIPDVERDGEKFGIVYTIGGGQAEVTEQEARNIMALVAQYYEKQQAQSIVDPRFQKLVH